jgi:outer membrane receptor protein involved in Fe transport
MSSKTARVGASRFAWLLLIGLIGGAPRAAIAQTSQPAQPAQPARSGQSAQPAHPEPSAQQPSPPPVSSFSTSVDVVGVTPVTGAGVLRDKIPSNVQSLDFSTNPRVGVSAADWLMTLASIQINEAQSNPFQPDLQFRGFTASPLLGLPQGLVAYQDGVRVNEPFGDTINWDLIPVNAIKRIDVMPGANPAFGSNALGGAIVVETKDGFSSAGHDLSFSTGAFGRWIAEGSSGAHLTDRHLAYFAAGRVLAEDGWRDFSPSRVRQGFGAIDWTKGNHTLVRGSASISRNRLVGNGVAPVLLLQEDRNAIFTHPDQTSTSLTQFNGRVTHVVSDRTNLDAVAYTRPSRVRSFNGDDTNYQACDDRPFRGGMCLDDEPVFDLSGRLIPAAPNGVELDATNNTSTTRNRGYGGSVQLSQISYPFNGHNQLAAGLTFDGARSRYESATELASLTDDRGTIGSGFTDAASLVGLRTTSRHVGLYVSDFHDVSAKLTISGSVRLNRTVIKLRDQIGEELNGDHEFTRLNPSIGATYALNDQVTAYASVGTTSRAPTPSELSCADPEDACRLPNAFVADPPLDQVRATTFEGGVRGNAGLLRWAASAFRTVNSDDIIFVSSGALTNEGYFRNIDQTTRQGLELTLQTPAHRLVSGSASYTFLDATFGVPLTLSSPNHPDEHDGEIDVEKGARLPGLPRHSAKFIGRVAGARGSVQASLNLTSSQFLRGDEANLLDAIDGYAVVNLAARFAVTPRVELFADVINLFDPEYETFGLLGEADDVLGDDYDDPRFVSPGAPRAAWLGVRLKF